MTEAEAIDYALEVAPRNEDGTVDEKVLVDLVAEALDFDEDEARRAQAKRLLDRRRRSGRTPADGQLVMFDTEPYDYEPSRLVATDDGHLIELGRSLAPHRMQEARRKAKNASAASRLAEREMNEATAFAEWTIERIQEGEAATTLQTDRFVREIGAWRPDDGPSAAVA